MAPSAKLIGNQRDIPAKGLSSLQPVREQQKEAVMAKESDLGTAYFNYWRDVFERSVLFCDILRRRGNDYREQSARTAPHVLSFDFALAGGRPHAAEGPSITRSSASLRLRTSRSIPRKRPFVIFDPRAGHGPGIGGMKHDSEIGVALRAGHPCYFVGFLPQPDSRSDDRGRLSGGGAISCASSPSGTSRPTASPR